MIKLSYFFIATLVFISCKSVLDNPKKPTIADLQNYWRQEGKIDVNPLIIFNDKVVGNFFELDSNSLMFRRISAGSIVCIPKDSPFFTEQWGKKAQNGVLISDDRILIDCAVGTKHIYLLNGKKIDNEIYNVVDSEKLTYHNRIDCILLNDGKRHSITILDSR